MGSFKGSFRTQDPVSAFHEGHEPIEAVANRLQGFLVQVVGHQARSSEPFAPVIFRAKALRSWGGSCLGFRSQVSVFGVLA